MNDPETLFIANDRVIICHLKGDYWIIPVPMPTRLAVGTIIGNDEVQRKLHQYGFTQWQKSRIWKAYVEQDTTCAGKLELLNKDIEQIFNRDLSNGAVLSKIIFPHIELESSNIIVDLQDNVGRFKKIVSDNCYTPNDPTWPNEWIMESRQTADPKLLIEKLKNYYVGDLTFNKDITSNQLDELFIRR
ncbi:hypothetical protein AB3K25_05125 [Leuconostoc sp. MS02]|uniref:Uncharacterized protein n=1 Tax=Leuconostoc aquikimchii TaxID=3236804 RepID=A0ABV3S2Z1_9LACO